MDHRDNTVREAHWHAHVTCLGGIGVIGGVRMSPKFLQNVIDELKGHLEDKNAPFGVDLLIPQIGGNARKTNVSSNFPCSSPFLCVRLTGECLRFKYDYTSGQLPELTEVIIKSKAALFVCAVGTSYVRQVFQGETLTYVLSSRSSTEGNGGQTTWSRYPRHEVSALPTTS